MRKLILMIVLLALLIVPVSAMEIEPPDVPDSGEKYMPENTESFMEGIWQIVLSAVDAFFPEISQSLSTCAIIIAIMILTTIVDNFPGNSGNTVHLVSAVLIGILLLKPTGTLIQLGLNTVSEMTNYGKLLLPVLTSALAAQGGVSTSASLYAVAVLFIAILSSAVTAVIVPMLYLYFCLTVVNSALGEGMIGSLRAFLKWLITWSLKIILYSFTGFMSITGVVSGSADASAVKAMKLTISGMVPVVGGIISDASESILVSAGVMKSAAGVYGILAVIAVFIGPFLKIGVQYLMLKSTAAVCSIFSGKEEAALIKDFSGGMGMVLGMTATVCLMLLISVVCFMKGVS